jgi:hypothetical protein
MEIDWLMKYLEELKAEGETHVFALVYDRHDATSYFYGGYVNEEQPKEYPKEIWAKATDDLNTQGHDVGDAVDTTVRRWMELLHENPANYNRPPWARKKLEEEDGEAKTN